MCPHRPAVIFSIHWTQWRRGRQLKSAVNTATSSQPNIHYNHDLPILQVWSVVQKLLTFPKPMHKYKIDHLELCKKISTPVRQKTQWRNRLPHLQHQEPKWFVTTRMNHQSTQQQNDDHHNSHDHLDQDGQDRCKAFQLISLIHLIWHSAGHIIMRDLSMLH